MFRHVDQASYAIKFPEIARGTDTQKRALLELVFQQLNHPVGMVAQAATRVILRLLMDGDADCEARLLERCRASADYEERIMPLIEAAVVREKRDSEAIRKLLAALRESSNFAVRTAATRCRSALGISDDDQAAKKTKLPPIYDFVVPPVLSEVYHSEKGRVGATEPLPDTLDATDMVKPFDLHLKIMSKASGIAFRTLCQRAVELISSWEAPENWDAEAERRFRGEMESVGLKLPFARRRTRLMRRAVFCMVTELSDANKLSKEDLGKFEDLLRYFDLALMYSRPEQRPAGILALEINSKDPRISDKDWLGSLPNGEVAGRAYANDKWVLLGEDTRLKGLAWSTPEEARRAASMKTTSVIPSLETWRELFGRVDNATLDEYHSIDVDDEESRLVVKNVNFAIDTNGVDWLALNPDIGRKMGWRKASDNFRLMARRCG